MNEELYMGDCVKLFLCISFDKKYTITERLYLNKYKND